MTTNTAATFQTPPSEHNIANVIASQPRVMYLNNPKNYKEEEDSLEGQPPADTVTATSGENIPSEPANHDWQKRYSDLKSYSDKEKNRLTTEKEELIRSVTEQKELLEKAKQPIEVPTTPEEMTAFKTKYGHLFNVMLTLIRQEHASVKSELSKADKETADRLKKLEAEKAFNQLLAIHPDADVLRNDSKFIEWVNSQIPAVRRLIESDKIDEVARGIDIYKKDNGIIKETASQKAAKVAAAARSVPTNTHIEISNNKGKVWKASEVKRLSRTEYGLREKEILQALQDGRYRENE